MSFHQWLNFCIKTVSPKVGVITSVVIGIFVGLVYYSRHIYIQGKMFHLAYCISQSTEFERQKCTCVLGAMPHSHTKNHMNYDLCLFSSWFTLLESLWLTKIR